MRFGASFAPIAKPGMDPLVETVRRHEVTHARHRADHVPRAAARSGSELPSLRACISAGEPLPASVAQAWHERTGIRIVDGIGSTEMLHIFIAARAEDVEVRLGRHARARLRGDGRRPGHAAAPGGRGGAPGGPRPDRLPLPRRPAADGVRRRRLEPHGRRVPRRRGRLLLVRGAQRRPDRLLRLQHLAVRGRDRAARARRRRRVRRRRLARRGPRPRREGVRRAPGGRQPATTRSSSALQTHVKERIAPYKYPRRIEFLDALPADPDRQGAAERAAPAGRPDHARAATARLAAAARLRQRDRGERPARVRRGPDRLGPRRAPSRPPTSPARSARRSRTCVAVLAEAGAGPRARRAADLVRHRPRRVPRRR